MYILKRILQFIPLFIGITFLSFSFIFLAGGDVVTQRMELRGTIASQELIDAERVRLGLDQPFLVQYLTWLKGILKGDMGISYISEKDVFSTFISKLPNTLLLTLSSILFTLCISLPLGIWGAIKQNKWMDYLIRFFSFIGNSMPNFFIAFILIYVFSIQFNLLPVISTKGNYQALILPTVTLTIAMSAKYIRQVRTRVLEELGKEYVVGAKARGIKFSIILWKKVLLNCMVTLITLLSLSIGNLLGGTVVVESIFLWDGVGKLAVDAIHMRDYPMIQAYVVWMAIIYVFINLITDILYQFLDPRIGFLGKKKKIGRSK